MPRTNAVLPSMYASQSRGSRESRVWLRPPQCLDAWSGVPTDGEAEAQLTCGLNGAHMPPGLVRQTHACKS